MSISQDDEHVQRFGRDNTHRLSGRSGDYVLWTRWTNLFAGEPSVLDVWQIRDGDWLLITNRTEDMPHWFELHPLETAGAVAIRMMKKLEQGHELNDPMDGPNIWKLMVGDRLVWLGAARQDQSSANGFLQVFELQENALAVGMSEADPDPSRWMHIEETSEALALCRKGLDEVIRLGMPREIAADSQWRIG